jgi:hypothetical protein
MFTRDQYLNGKCTHRQYYAQLVTESHRLAAESFGIDNLRRAFAEDEHFNSIPLASWDARAGLRADYKSLGDGRSLAGDVCILKEAARQLIES